ncbi:hypothetical protein CBR_g63088 [Chara braunii]|uniref:Uncharacterized protein n=1 Tax=Chara braunii TaxID=69332 RepID=A0A388K8X9_CHABU|nr:hypothetical protein CBR_g63088 [Chara braunii]|eukprot:GBG66505.1 hypothetical protein CBR_g63088 [Chara braunii]
MDEVARRSRSADSNTDRHGNEEMNAMMREYFVELAREKRERRKREELEEKSRKEAEAREAKERRRMQCGEERQRREADRDARLLRIIKGELMKEPCAGNSGPVVREKQKAKLNGYRETVEEEKERLRRMIVKQEEEEVETEDDELRLLRLRASKLELKEKRKRGPEVSIGNSSPMTTPGKRSHVKLTDEAKCAIEELKRASTEEGGTSLIPRRIDLSLKHISAACGVRGKKNSVEECKEFFDALTVEEIKEICRKERVPYGNRDAAIKRLVIRKSAVAYDPAFLPFPPTPTMKTRSKCATAEVKEETAVYPDSTSSDSDESTE